QPRRAGAGTLSHRGECRVVAANALPTSLGLHSRAEIAAVLDRTARGTLGKGSVAGSRPTVRRAWAGAGVIKSACHKSDLGIRKDLASNQERLKPLTGRAYLRARPRAGCPGTKNRKEKDPCPRLCSLGPASVLRPNPSPKCDLTLRRPFASSSLASTI